jgi:uncharacterized protein (DUF2236 family)
MSNDEFKAWLAVQLEDPEFREWWAETWRPAVEATTAFCLAIADGRLFRALKWLVTRKAAHAEYERRRKARARRKRGR